MSNHKDQNPAQKSGFRSQADRRRDEALSCRYGRIGIQAVAAAKSACQHTQAANGPRQLGWDYENAPVQQE